jgi:hypothetical protein
MIKVILGSALGGLVAGGIALLAGSQARNAQVQLPYSGSMMPVAQSVAQSAGPGVQCAPNQQATMARVIVNGQELMTLACVDRVNDGMAYYQPAPPMMAAPMAYAQPISYVPVQTAPAPQVVDDHRWQRGCRSRSGGDCRRQEGRADRRGHRRWRGLHLRSDQALGGAAHQQRVRDAHPPGIRTLFRCTSGSARRQRHSLRGTTPFAIAARASSSKGASNRLPLCCSARNSSQMNPIRS